VPTGNPSHDDPPVTCGLGMLGEIPGPILGSDRGFLQLDWESAPGAANAGNHSDFVTVQVENDALNTNSECVVIVIKGDLDASLPDVRQLSVCVIDEQHHRGDKFVVTDPSPGAILCRRDTVGGGSGRCSIGVECDEIEELSGDWRTHIHQP